MTNYDCCYSSGRQFIFTERPTWVIGCFLWAAIFGMVSGLIIGVIVTVGGSYTFDLMVQACATFAVCRGYYMAFWQQSSTVDMPAFFLICLFFGSCIAAIWLIVRYSMSLELHNYCALFSAIGVVLGEIVMVFAFVCLSEDERKHHLVVCSPTGEIMDVVAPLRGATGTANADSDLHAYGWTAVLRYIAFIRRAHIISSTEVTIADDRETDSIIVYNRTLKLIKVCLYASDDMLCWVPHGGVSGHCVGVIPSEQSRRFTPARSWLVKGGLKLKVFQPGLFDKELACLPHARMGQSFSFHDVEGMIKRSRLLSATPAPRRVTLTAVPAESSESEFETVKAAPFERKMSPIPGSPSRDSGGPMKRNRSAGSLQMHKLQIEPFPFSGQSSQNQLNNPVNAGDAPQQGSVSGEASAALRFPSTQNRRAGPNEIVVRNRSNQEIRALLFRSTDYSFIVPLIGHLLSCGDMILPEMERRFNPTGDEKEFTVKVYSVGAGAKELTYLTVQRGQVYTFCDSLLS